MYGGIGPSAEAEREAAAYAALLAGFRAFTLHRRVNGQRGMPAVYRGDDPAEVGQLRRLLAAHPCGAVCGCFGSAAISLEGGPAPTVLSVHHGVSVRWPGTRCGDLELEHGRELAEWLAARSLADVRDEMDESARTRARSRAAQEAWITAMPASLLAYRDAMLNVSRTGVSPPPELLRQLSGALRRAERNQEGRIRALLRWHASGSGRCSGYPVHEGIPAELLLAESPRGLLAAVSADDVTAAETAGAARLVASWAARGRREFDSLPPAAWDRLTAAVADGDDNDKRDRLARRRAESEGSALD